MIKITENFLDKLKNLDELIIREMVNLVSHSLEAIHIDKTRIIAKEVNIILDNILKIVPEKFGSSIHYILGELTDNIEQHSNYKNVYIFYNYNSKENQLSIVILDDGLGIPGVFRKNNLSFSKDSEAIKMAFEGTTTKKEDITRGYGLRTIKSIVKALNGSIKIISNKAMLNIENSKMEESNFKNNKLDGTLIYLKLKTPKKDLNIYHYIE